MGSAKSKLDSSPNAGNDNKIDLQSFYARIDRVKVKGVQRTYDDYVERTAKKVLTAKNFGEILVLVKETREELLELGVFKNLTAVIDVSKGAGATPHGYEVTFVGEELTRIKGNIGTEIGPQEGCFSAELSSPNLFGRGERLLAHGSYSNLQTRDYILKFLKPFYHTRLGAFKPELSVALSRHSNLFDWSNFKTDQTGITFEASILGPWFVTHSLRYGMFLRDTIPDKLAPFFVREDCGPTLKNVLTYSAILDTRDSAIFPSQGIRIKTTHELINDSFKRLGYLKHDLHGEINCPLFAGLSMQFSGRAGLIQDLGNKAHVSIPDAFFLGGPHTLRGFYPGGANEHKEGAAMGSTTYWLASAHLWSPLPFCRRNSGFGNLFRTQLFCNVGQTGGFDTDNLRATIGTGIALKIGGTARLEFNYCYPVWFKKTDPTKSFQFGIGFEFT